VEAATIGIPLGGPGSTFGIAGRPADDSVRIRVTLAGADYLRTFAIPLRAGRMFDGSEVSRGDRVAVINEAAARLWPAGENPLGSRVRLTALERVPPGILVEAGRPPDFTVVGVVADTRNSGVGEPPQPALVIPYSIAAPASRALAIRSAGDPSLLLNPVRAQLRAMDPEQPLVRPMTFAEIMGQQLIQPRFTMALFTAFAVIGLALAAAGIYSVLSFHVTRRRHELGVRMALGAPRRHVLTLMLTMGGRLAAIGLAVGLAASVAATRLLGSQLPGVEPADPLAYAAVAFILAVVTLAACYVPARRAAGVDPMIALREE
jgi:predicted permease